MTVSAPKPAASGDLDEVRLKAIVESSPDIEIESVSSASFKWVGGLRKLGWDSDHFGFGIGQVEPLMYTVDSLEADNLNCGVQLISKLVAKAEERRLQQLVASIPSGDAPAQWCLQKSGFFMTDTLVTHTLGLASWTQSGELAAGVRVAVDADKTALAEIAAECFGNRKYNVNRFNSDPIFAADKVRDLYKIWIQKSIGGPLADLVFVYEEQGQPLGFITLKTLKEDASRPGWREGDIPLNAVHPDYHGKGIYKKLVAAAVDHFANAGVQSVSIKTQLPNHAVHKAWSQIGAKVTQTVHRFHRQVY
jgi:GNAT superfamily N-acetyltransferase